MIGKGDVGEDKRRGNVRGNVQFIVPCSRTSSNLRLIFSAVEMR